MDSIFQRMIGQSSTISDLPQGKDKDPILHEDPDGTKYYQVDSLLSYTRALGASYFYFPNLNELLSLSS